jgi:hypothetical protein
MRMDEEIMESKGRAMRDDEIREETRQEIRE